MLFGRKCHVVSSFEHRIRRTGEDVVLQGKEIEIATSGLVAFNRWAQGCTSVRLPACRRASQIRVASTVSTNLIQMRSTIGFIITKLLRMQRGLGVSFSLL